MKIKTIAFVESSRSLGGSAKCMVNLFNHFSKTKQCHLITNHRGCFEPVFANFQNWHILSAPLNIQTRRFIWGWLTDIKLISKYVWLYQKIAPDLVYLNNDTYSNRHAAFAAILLKIPYILHARGELFDSQLTTYMLSKSCLNIGISDYISNQLIARTQQIIRNVKIYDAIEAAGTASSPKLQPGAPVKIAHIGNFTGWKGQALMLEALAQAQQLSDHRLQLTFFGSFDQNEPEYQKCVTLIEQHQLQQHVTFAGMIPAVTKHLDEYSIVVNSSTSPEPFGLTMVEGMQLGKVVIGPNYGGPSEVIEDNRNGLLFESNSSSSLAQTIILAIEKSQQAAFIQQTTERGDQFKLAPMLKKLDRLLEFIES